jgi:transcription elongation factor S-II
VCPDRKHSDGKVAELANALTSKWKEVVKARGGGGESTPKASQPSPAPAEEKKGKGAPEAKKEKPAVPRVETPKAAPKAEMAKAGLKREVSSASSVSSEGGGSKRDKVRELLKKVLKPTPTDGVVPGVDVDALATEIEEALYRHFNESAGDEYTNQVKSVKFNLSDPKNKDFKSGVLKGLITPDQIPTLTSTQMAGKEKIQEKKKNMDAKIFQDKLFVTAQNQGAESDMFKCSKCKQSRTTFYQKQTRSADEPMTVFITCRVCGHEWRDGG